VVPRDEDGTFISIDPKQGGYWGDAFYEDGSWAYSWNDVHDMKHLVELMGGKEMFVQRLDLMFDQGIFDSSNEPYVSSLLPSFYPFSL
jgi:putative alpha-1,2-mannosidase